MSVFNKREEIIILVTGIFFILLLVKSEKMLQDCKNLKEDYLQNYQARNLCQHLRCVHFWRRSIERCHQHRC